MSYIPKNAVNTRLDDRQSIRIRQLEDQFQFKFSPWMHAFAMTVTEPVKVYSHMHAPKKCDISWDSEKKIMDFSGSNAAWKLGHVKTYLGKELYEHFGHVKFSINGYVLEEKKLAA